MPNNVQAIERRPLSTEVTRMLKDMIVTGELAPGERLFEVELAQRMGTSRTPVREAIVRLENERFVQKRDRGGYQVRPLTRREVEEAVGLRAVLESYATELVAEKVRPAFIAKLEKNVAMFEKALKRGDKKRLVELNTRFHEMLYTAAGSEMLSELISNLHDVLYRFRRALLGDLDAAQSSLADHRKMVQALKQGDATKARRICRGHVQRGGQWMMERIEKGELEL